jgi:hypothetical protein
VTGLLRILSDLFPSDTNQPCAGILPLLFPKGAAPAAGLQDVGGYIQARLVAWGLVQVRARQHWGQNPDVPVKAQFPMDMAWRMLPLSLIMLRLIAA